jgi:hypothetical protein
MLFIGGKPAMAGVMLAPIGALIAGWVASARHAAQKKSGSSTTSASESVNAHSKAPLRGESSEPRTCPKSIIE